MSAAPQRRADASDRPAAGAGLVAELEVERGGFRLDAAVAVGPDEVLAVLGPNGSGKSTMLGAIAGHVPLDRGEVRIGGRLLGGAGAREVPLAARRVGLLGQQALLFPHLSALENVAFGPRAQGAGRRESRAEAAAWLERVGLAGFEHHRPAELSGGQQQRVALARTLAAKPAALLLDEPFAALDVEAAAGMRRLVREHRAALGIPMLLVTHDPLDALVLAGHAAILQAGRLVDEGPIARVLGHPRTPFIAALAGVDLVEGVALDAATVRASGGLVLRAAEPAGLVPGARASAVFAPGAVHVAPGAAPARGGDAEANHWSGTVASLEPTGGGVRIVTAEHPGVAVDVPTAAAVALDLEAGAALAFRIEAADVSLRPLD
ncbi:ABC transporter ATP-binding protein [Agromyces sp. NBRC 114283]|uniref:ABC transporter ATP-binding protein n=1 Tax=Agromyces sp. NBRC 114283 TaxID=2994521 RepID=UPI0024A3AD0D|nr:ABC transporter ATP-binding protein [Agromyces sp. NBRC 114283]GLU90851.1 ABC transporter ATP-binding protein [Agromyces sp. NBRC 114283]